MERGEPVSSSETQGLTAELSQEVAKLEHLFDQGQADLAKLLQARQRLIQLKSAEIDSIWAATQAQADLLLALGAPALLQRMLNQTENAAVSASRRAGCATRSGSIPIHSCVAPRRDDSGDERGQVTQRSLAMQAHSRCRAIAMRPASSLNLRHSQDNHHKKNI